MNNEPRLIETYLIDGTNEGIKVIEPADGPVTAYVIPRIKLADTARINELTQPSIYILFNADDSECYIGKANSFNNRIKDHERKKDFWDYAVVFVSSSNRWDGADIDYLEHLTVKLAKETGSIKLHNQTIPNNTTVRQNRVYLLENAAKEIGFIASLLGNDLFTPQEKPEQVWYCNTNLTQAKAVFRGDKFVVLAGSIIDKSAAPAWVRDHENQVVEREFLFKKYGKDNGSTVELMDNVGFISPNHAGRIVAGRSVNAWTTWKNEEGKTMDQVMRRSE